ncbi:MAG: hypothetical protein ACRC1P_10380 [Cellulosilyticaceae bacterium]
MSTVICIGERTLSGKHKRVYSAGEVHMEESEICSVYGAGEIEINQSKVNKVRAAGELNVYNSTLLDVNAVGEINLKGVTKAKYMIVHGELNSECLECNHLVVDDKTDRRSYVNSKNRIDAKIEGFVKTDILENYAKLDMTFEYEVDTLINGGELIVPQGIECESLYSFGKIKSEEVNAENIYIMPLEDSRIKQIMGSHIQITKEFQLDKFLKNMPKKYFKKYFEGLKYQKVGIIEVQAIEGDRVILNYVKAELVSGIDVVIGDLCIIDRVEYSGSIKISPKAVVNEVVKL